MDRVDRPEGRGNTGETADFFFHPSRPSGFGYLVHRKSLISPLKSVCGANRAPLHLGNPGIIIFAVSPAYTTHLPALRKPKRYHTSGPGL